MPPRSKMNDETMFLALDPLRLVIGARLRVPAKYITSTTGRVIAVLVGLYLKVLTIPFHEASNSHPNRSIRAICNCLDQGAYVRVGIRHVSGL